MKTKLTLASSPPTILLDGFTPHLQLEAEEEIVDVAEIASLRGRGGSMAVEMSGSGQLFFAIKVSSPTPFTGWKSC